MSKYKLLVFTDPVPGKEDEYNTWYNDRHIHDVVNMPGFTGAQRFKVKRVVLGEVKNSYLAIYDLDSEAVDEDIERMLRAGGTEAMPASDSLDFNRIDSWLFEECSPPIPSPR